jgi:pilus assembly protein CpaB
VMRMSGGQQPAPAAQVAQQPQIKSVNIYVAATNIPIGTSITKEMIASQPWPEHLALPGFIILKEGAPPVEGMVARAPFQQNEPIISSKLANPNDPNFLAGELPKGMRVVTIPVNEVDGIAGFVFPGDHVDIIYTHDVQKWETPPPSGGDNAPRVATKVKATVTETLLTNVKVLAVDQRASGEGATDKNGKLVIPRSASLMVSQADAQRVRLAQKTGTVGLVLRALADKEEVDPLLVTTGQDVTQTPDVAGDAGGTGSSIKILRGAPRTEKETQAQATAIARGASTSSGTAAVGTAVATPTATSAAPAVITPAAPAPVVPSAPQVINPGLVAIP